MKKLHIPLLLSFLFISLLLNAQTQIINLHSVKNNREAFTSGGYTLDGARMITSRAKLTYPNNFGTHGTYPKSVVITDNYELYGSLSQVVSLNNNEIFFFGNFNKITYNNFQTQEINDLYNWSLNGGKMIIAAGFVDFTFNNNYEILDNRWGFKTTTKSPSYIIPNSDGNNTDIFNGPFGIVLEALQGGYIQGYFSTYPPNSKILGIDITGSPTLIMDCNTLDLITADVDVFTDLGGISNSGIGLINNYQDKFWANTIVFMDKLQPLPIVTQNNNEVSVQPVFLEYQWYFNDIAIPNANSSTLVMIDTGAYKVEVKFNGGCKKMSSIINYNSLATDKYFSYESNLILYPNPAKTTIKLINNSLTFDNFDVSIFDAAGSIVYKKSFEKKENQIDISNLSTGIYIVKIQNENVVVNKKLIIN